MVAAMDASYAPASSSGGFFDGLGSLLSKVGTTAVDVLAAQQLSKIGTANNPNVNPAALQAALQAQQQQNDASISKYMPYIIGGVALVGLILGAVVISRRSN